MKQMRNLLTRIFLMLGMLLTTLPVVAQGIEAELDSVAKRDDVTSTEQKENTVDVKEIVDEAIAHANKKTLKHFFDVLFAKRYDDEDMIILTEKDFV